MTEAIQISHPRVTNNSGNVDGVLDSTIASTTTLQAGAVTVIHMQHVHGKDEKTLADRVREAYKYELEPEEIELHDRAARQFGRRLDSKE